MNGPFWNDPNVGVTGEALFDRDKRENYETSTDADGKITTRILPQAE